MGRQVDLGKRGEWADRLSRQGSSGVTVAEFCEWEGVSVAAFYQWRKKLGRAPAGHRSMGVAAGAGRLQRLSLPDAAAFIPVHVVPSSATGSLAFQIEIRLPNGVRILAPMPDSRTLRDVFLAASAIPSGRDAEVRQEFDDGHMKEDARC